MAWFVNHASHVSPNLFGDARAALSFYKQVFRLVSSVAAHVSLNHHH
jgi:uncharacterized glyoxalase superfamily protein PhnB